MAVLLCWPWEKTILHLNGIFQLCLVSSDLKITTHGNGTSVFHTKSSVTRESPFSILWVGRHVSPRVARNSLAGGEETNKKSATTEYGVILGIRLTVIMMKANALDQWKWTLAIPWVVA